MFSATLFDYNGVLVDDEHVHLAAFQDVLAPLGIHLDEQAYWDHYLGFDDPNGFREALRRHGRPIDEAHVAELVALKKPCYLRRAKDVLRGFPGAAELLRARADVGPVVIVSGALEDEIVLGLQVLNAASCVQKIVSSEHTSKSKPDPEGYELGLVHLAALGVRDARAETVVFEDSLDGIRAAKAAGLCCIGIGHSYPVAKLKEAGADATVGKIAQVDEDLLRRVYNETRA